MITISQIFHLPQDISQLEKMSEKEGFKFIQRLIYEYQSENLPFSKIGEALFEARTEAQILIGIGGITQDPYSNSNLGRLRRFYIHPEYRNIGIGRLLLSHIEHFGQEHFDKITLYTDTVDAALFYEKNGYIAQLKQKQTHYKNLIPK